MKLLVRSTARALAFALALGPAAALATCTRDAILVFDGSGSMSTPAADPPHLPRIDDARTALARALPDVVALRRVGLVVYGPGPLPACDNVELRVPPTRDAAQILREVAGVVPGGDTPLTQAVARAAKALSPEGIIVVITDGRETCGGGSCALARDIAAQTPGMTIHVIGFKIWENFNRWPGYSAEAGELERQPSRCLSDATGGMFVDTDTVDQLAEALRETLGCPLIGGLQPPASGSSLPTPEKTNLKGAAQAIPSRT